jgi:hypothetical protein
MYDKNELDREMATANNPARSQLDTRYWNPGPHRPAKMSIKHNTGQDQVRSEINPSMIFLSL